MGKASPVENLTRDFARAEFAAAGLSYSDLTLATVRSLRRLINREMVISGLMKSTYRCSRSVVFQNVGLPRFFAGLHCDAFYFKRREAVSFNPDGFIGFAGWSDDTNVQPILRGFVAWVGEMKKCKEVARVEG